MTDQPTDPDLPVAPEPDAPDAPTPAEEAEPTTTFADLGLRPEVQRTLDALGYEEPTPIQRESIGPLVAGRDLLGQAATGTGKTAAFALPILERIAGPADQPVALILVPTRELAIQVSEAVYRYGKDLGVEVLPVYGGQPVFHQIKVLRRGVHVVVATPGRAVDHIERGTLPLDEVEVVVLDEADEMLDMGFAEDLDTILDALPESRQTVLFSATMPPRIDGIAKRHLTDPVRIEIAREATAPGEAPRVRQAAYLVARNHKAAALGRILDVESPAATLVFCKTRGEVDELTETLNGRGYRAEALGVHPTTATRLCDRLVGKHLVERRSSEVDRRQVLLGISPRGRRMVARVDDRRRAGLAGVVEQLDPEQRRLVIEAMSAFTAAAESASAGGTEVVA